MVGSSNCNSGRMGEVFSLLAGAVAFTTGVTSTDATPACTISICLAAALERSMIVLRR